MMNLKTRLLSLLYATIAFLSFYFCLSGVLYFIEPTPDMAMVLTSIVLGTILILIAKKLVPEIGIFNKLFSALLLLSFVFSGILALNHIFWYPEFLVISFMLPGAIVYLGGLYFIALITAKHGTHGG